MRYCSLRLAFPPRRSSRAKIPRIGYFSGVPPPPGAPRREAFRQGLRELGYIEGKNIVIEYRYARENSTGFLSLQPSWSVSRSTSSSRRVRSHPRCQGSDQDDSHRHGECCRSSWNGLVASLARPGGNITGLHQLAPELSGKRLELLKESVPRLSRVAVLWEPADPRAPRNALKENGTGGRALGRAASIPGGTSSDDFETPFKPQQGNAPRRSYVLTDRLLSIINKRIVDFAAKNRLPAMYSNE